MPSQLIALAASKFQEAKILTDPFRRSGPSVYEASEHASQLRAEANSLLCDAFYNSPMAKGAQGRFAGASLKQF